MEVHGNDSYTLKVDGTGRVTRRNRRYLRHFLPASPEITGRHFLKSLHPSHATNISTPSPPFAPVVLPPISQAVPVVPQSSLGQKDQLIVAEKMPVVVEGPLKIPSQRTGDVAPSGRHPTEVDDVVVAAPDLTISPECAPAVSARPRRSINRPARYEPETGHWV